ncbi:class I SAM-dependent DNA methyltransferase [Streptosporangium lutulentum]|uniref:SAM-dependent methyltransferase n=1 Tax=Streptosporangium lutulentum TaxID=1461250 RepID=A0ABT9Q4X6_9ACTN|nr:class I SAM-dependent methyltransferase [Streptosporangium lutulentum]MDP9841786.1 SAM-dependent methyltransferase [Streptosporangium lutulentum]
MHSHNRASIGHQIKYALRRPQRIPRHVRRLSRNAWLRLSTRDHIDYYRAVMKSDVSRSSERAVGSKSHGRWLALGQMQFDYLERHGLRPEHRMLEIGCGNLRAGRLFIDYLDTGNYYGIDISPDVLMAAQGTLVDHGLRDKLPHLMPVKDLRFAALPDEMFDVVHAHSVFSHSPLHVIEECFQHIGRIMKPDGWFDFTFDRTEGKEHQILREDFYYRTETLLALADKHGLRGTFMDDWERLRHRQSKIRVTHPGAAPVTGRAAAGRPKDEAGRPKDEAGRPKDERREQRPEASQMAQDLR